MVGRAGKAFLLLATCGLVAGIAASAAQAADVNVNTFRCQNQGGAVTVPTGSTIVIRQGFSEQTLGILTAFLNAQTTMISLDGTIVDVSDAFSDPVKTPAGDWLTLVTYPTGITLGAGDSLRVVWTTTVAHVVPEVFNPAAGGPPGQPSLSTDPSTFTCTVTTV
jgi:hypothetical protein